LVFIAVMRLFLSIWKTTGTLLPMVFGHTGTRLGPVAVTRGFPYHNEDLSGEGDGELCFGSTCLCGVDGNLFHGDAVVKIIVDIHFLIG
jgi:hypothetical protein